MSVTECHILKPGEVAHSSQADAIMEDEPDVLKLKVQGKNAKASLIVPVRRVSTEKLEQSVFVILQKGGSVL